jgi:hypothetical protein
MSFNPRNFFCCVYCVSVCEKKGFLFCCYSGCQASLFLGRTHRRLLSRKNNCIGFLPKLMVEIIESNRNFDFDGRNRNSINNQNRIVNLFRWKMLRNIDICIKILYRSRNRNSDSKIEIRIGIPMPKSKIPISTSKPKSKFRLRHRNFDKISMCFRRNFDFVESK